MRSWDLKEIDAPAGTRDPVVLATEEDARAVLIRIDAGQKLGDHQVKERAWIAVVDGSIRVSADGETKDCGVGTLLMFNPGERHAFESEDGARILLLLAPWPALNHYVGDQRP